MTAAWQRCKLGDALTLKRGYDLPERDRRIGPYPIVSSSGVTGYHSEPKAAGPGVVTGRYGTLGEVFYVENDFWPLNTSLYVIDFKGNDRKFVSYFLRQLNFRTRNAAGAVPGVNRNHLHAIDVDLPPLAVQHRIAELLSGFDDLIANKLRRIKILEEMARSTYREWFVCFRFPDHRRVRQAESPLEPVPEGWRGQVLGDIAEEIRRNVPKGALPSPIRSVGLEHIPRRSLALDAWDTVTDLGSNKLAFKCGEVLFGKIRPYFHKVSIAPFDGLCLADTIVLRPRRPEHYGLVVAIASSDEFVDHASATANGAKMPRANWDVLRKFPIVLPPAAVRHYLTAAPRQTPRSTHTAAWSDASRPFLTSGNDGKVFGAQMPRRSTPTASTVAQRAGDRST